MKYKIPSDPPEVGDLVIEQFWEDGDTNHDLVDTDFDNATMTTWSIVLAKVNSGSGRTWSFTAWVKDISPAEVSGRAAYKRTITFCIPTVVSRS